MKNKTSGYDKKISPALGSRTLNRDDVRKRLTELLDYYQKANDINTSELARRLGIYPNGFKDPMLKQSSPAFIAHCAYVLNFSIDYVLFGENAESVTKFKECVRKDARVKLEQKYKDANTKLEKLLK